VGKVGLWAEIDSNTEPERQILLSGIVPGLKKAFRGDRAICWKGKQIPHGCAVRNDRLFGN